MHDCASFLLDRPQALGQSFSPSAHQRCDEGVGVCARKLMGHFSCFVMVIKLVEHLQKCRWHYLQVKA
jgi:hypothetical protein